MMQHWMLWLQQWMETYLCDATLVAMATTMDGDLPMRCSTGCYGYNNGWRLTSVIQHWMLWLQQWMETYLCDATLDAMATTMDGDLPLRCNTGYYGYNMDGDLPL